MSTPVYRVLETPRTGQDGRAVWQVVRPSGGSGYAVLHEALRRETAQAYADELNTVHDIIDGRLALE